MILKWHIHEGQLEAVGQRGIYQLTQQPNQIIWRLTGNDHHAIPMLGLAPPGRPFQTQQDARNWAQRLDDTRAREPEAGGE